MGTLDQEVKSLISVARPLNNTDSSLKWPNGTVHYKSQGIEMQLKLVLLKADNFGRTQLYHRLRKILLQIC